MSRFTTKQCPRCRSTRIRRKERKGWLQERFMPAFGFYPYHCGQCKHDFYLTLREVKNGSKVAA